MPKKEINKYFEATGRRKTSVARVRLFAHKEGILVNTIPHTKYFPTLEMQKIVESAFEKIGSAVHFGVSAHVLGGGIHSQSEAVRHGIARALLVFDPELRIVLKRPGFLTRDPRMKERRKFGLKKARKSPQWAKR